MKASAWVVWCVVSGGLIGCGDDGGVTSPTDGVDAVEDAPAGPGGDATEDVLAPEPSDVGDEGDLVPGGEVGLGDAAQGDAQPQEDASASDLASGDADAAGPVAPPYLGIGAGQGSSCAIRDGAVYCWGARPVAVAGLEAGVTAVSVGDGFACAIKDGGAWCWGVGTDGQLGDGRSMTSGQPVQPVGLGAGVSAVSAGSAHACAVQSGAVKCWGKGSAGQLGAGDTIVEAAEPVAVSGLDAEVTAIGAGLEHTCAVRDGAAMCWGSRAFNKVGDGAPPGSPATTPVAVAGLREGVRLIEAGENFSCAALDDGIRCWGNGTFGQLGDGQTASASGPVAVSGIGEGVEGLSIGVAGRHACAIVSGAARCWGHSTNGQVGNLATNSDVLTPAEPLGLGADVTAISAGTLHTCGIQAGVALCWGSNLVGQLGIDAPLTMQLSWPSTPVVEP